MKLIFTFLSFIILSFTPLSVERENYETFISNCDSYYSTYYLDQEIKKESYELYVVVSESNNEIGYSILFNPSDYKGCSLVLVNNGKTYAPQENNYGGCSLYNLVIYEDTEIQIQKDSITTTTYDLKYLDNESYQNLYKDKYIQGKGNFIEATYLSKAKPVTELTFILSLVFAIIIVVSIVVILVLAICKKGLFNKDKFDEEFKQEHDLRDAVDSFFKNINNENDNNYNSYNNNNNNTFEVEAEEIKEEQPKEVYTKTHSYDFDEIRDISEVLKEKGFNTNYKDLSTDDKNKVMLELMRMKEFKEITEEEYRSEVIKLWM